MKKVFIFGIAIFGLITQSCGPKEKQEETSTSIDSVMVESNTIDTTAILTDISEEENSNEEVKQVQKEETPE